MKIISKRDADQIKQATPKCVVGKFDGAKYKTPVGQYIGRNVQDVDGVLAVYPERRQDEHGGFVVLRCLYVD